jgi:tRNA uracil 4-sulfurtransferase
MQSEQHCILIHFGELWLKGKNQFYFRRRLRDNIRKRLAFAGLRWPMQESSSYLMLTVPAHAVQQRDAAVQALRQVFGLVWVAPAIRFPHRNFVGDFQADDFARLYSHLLPMANRLYAPGKTFCVRVKRPNKLVPFTSPALAAKIGEWILENTPWKQVNLHTPDLTFELEIHKGHACLFSERFSGSGGLPVGAAGRVLALLSGGIDSPVASYLMAKRGCQIDFIHFTASFASQENLENDKIYRLARILNNFTLGSRLFVVPYTYFDLALMQGNVDYEVVLFRRFMVRVAGQLAQQLKCRALVTGDNLSQVASQTLSNLASTAQASELPLFQPLLGFDKNEIIALAERIGTLEESLKPYKDCCALISRHPRTSSRHKLLTKLEEQALPNYQEIMARTLAEAICVELL